MRYRTRKGIVLTSVGGQKILVSAAALHDQVPYVTNINDTTALCWERLSEGADEKEVISCILDQFETEDAEAVRSDISSLLVQLYEGGYIIEE